MIRLFLLLAFISFSVFSTAQSPLVQSVEPIALHNSAPRDADIVINFDSALDPASVSNATVRIFGRWSGPASGDFTLEDGDKSIRFALSEPFFAGEWVTVSLTKGIQSAAGDSMQLGYTWNFWTATAPGSMDLELVDEIEVREPGEGLIQVYGAYAGDLNNDGYSDLTVINETSDDLRIFLNDGTGGYSDFEKHNMGNMTPSPNEGADFNNDGEIDLAVSTAHHDEVRVLIGDGSGSFVSQTNYTVDGEGVRGLAIVDCNGDGSDDIFFANRLSDNMGLLMNDGTGSFTASAFNSSGNGETACAIADANGDGIPDIFMGFYSSQELGILLGDGAGNFTLSDKVSVQGRPWMVAVGDFNGDGNADMASANSFSNISAVAFGDGTGNLSTPTHYDYEDYQFPLAMDLGDLDGDGDLDMVTSNYESATYTIFENDGNGAFTPVINLTAPNKASCAILHDRDNDGDLDIAATDEADDVIRIFDNPGIVDAVDNELIQNLNLTVSPNPFNEKMNIQFNLTGQQQVGLKLLNAGGQVERTLYSGQLLEGEHRFEFTGGGLLSGVYLLQLSVDDRVVSEVAVKQ